MEIVLAAFPVAIDSMLCYTTMLHSFETHASRCDVIVMHHAMLNGQPSEFSRLPCHVARNPTTTARILCTGHTYICESYARRVFNNNFIINKSELIKYVEVTRVDQHTSSGGRLCIPMIRICPGELSYSILDRR